MQEADQFFAEVGCGWVDGASTESELAPREAPHPRPFPHKLHGGRENSIPPGPTSRRVSQEPPPPAPPRSYLAERGEFDLATTGIPLRRPGSPTPGPSPLVPRGEGRIRSRCNELLPFSLPHAVCGGGPARG